MDYYAYFSRFIASMLLGVTLSIFTSPSSQASITTEGDAFFGGEIYVATQSGDGKFTLTAPTVLQGGGIFVAQGDFTGEVIVDGGIYQGGGNVFQIGEQGTGTLEIKNGGEVSSDTGADLVVGGGSGSTGYVSVSGSGSILDMPNGEAVIGDQGYGSLTIQESGQVTHQNVFVGGGEFPSAPGVGTGIAKVVGVGSRWSVERDLNVGSGGGSGELWIQEGGRVDSALTSSSPFSVIGGSGSTGILVVEGTGSIWQQHGFQTSSGTVIVGLGGSGTVAIREGGKVISPDLSVGGEQFDSSGGSGLVTIDGLGSQWTTSQLKIGSAGSGDVIVTNGGKLISFGNTGSSATVIGNTNGSYGRLVIDGLTSQWIDNSQEVTIGDQGIGELVIRNGASVTNENVDIAWSGSGHGEALITGPGSRWTVGSLAMGAEGTAKITVADSAQLHWINNGQFSVGRKAELELNNGSVHATGFGQNMTNRGTIGGDGDIYSSTVLNFPTGRIRVDSGQELKVHESLNNEGRVELLGGDLEVGNQLVNDFQSSVVMENTTLRTGQFDNNGGTLTVASGINQIFGDIDNEGNVILSGNSQTTFYDDVINDGTFNVSTGSVATFFGEVSGNGIGGGGTSFLEGDITPGFSPGIMAFGGDISLGDFSSLTMELTGSIPGTENDQLQVGGTATLGGELIIDAQAGLGDVTLTLLEAASIVGEFDQTPTLFSHVGSGMFLTDIDYTSTAVTVSLVENLADFNLDGFVDGDDLEIWETGYGQGTGAGLGDGDANGDRVASGLDFLAWQRKYNPEIPELVGAIQTVPEPSSALLFAVLVVLRAGKRTR